MFLRVRGAVRIKGLKSRTGRDDHDYPGKESTQHDHFTSVGCGID